MGTWSLDSWTSNSTKSAPWFAASDSDRIVFSRAWRRFIAQFISIKTPRRNGKRNEESTLVKLSNIYLMIDFLGSLNSLKLPGRHPVSSLTPVNLV